ncbi:M14 family zinc carboxypeptidase [Fibrobacter succinogenes]|uniref:M14 family zinc carboxypeptidase n=1 Tax=Fibrobacter succinogenes TaxID=833 RepID=UPI0026F206B2|nr:M14 family zinc carboxypeptidase [Fibrobacter succinogenes]
MFSGVLHLPFKEYGRSATGCPLRYIPCDGDCHLLVIAGIHGEEPETTFLLSRALRLCGCMMEHTAFVLCANPDGITLGTRANANGVDLNRNFPTSNWSSEPVHVRSVSRCTPPSGVSTPPKRARWCKACAKRSACRGSPTSDTRRPGASGHGARKAARTTCKTDRNALRWNCRACRRKRSTKGTGKTSRSG